MSQPVKRRSKLPTLTGNKGEDLSVAVIYAINEPAGPSNNNNNNVVFAPESGILHLHVSAAFGKKNSEKCSPNELVNSALLDAFIGFFRANGAPMRIQRVSSSEALEGQTTQTILSLSMFPAPLSRLLVHPESLKRLESLSVTLAFKASPCLNESQDQATNSLRSVLLTSKKKLPASYSSLVFRAAQNLAKNLASRYPTIFNASWVDRLLVDSAQYRSISRSVTGLLCRPYPAISDSIAAAFTLLRTNYPSSMIAGDTQDTPQYDDPEDSQMYNQASQAHPAKTDNQEAIQKALFALALHQTKRTPLFTDKEPAKEWTHTNNTGAQLDKEARAFHHKTPRSRSSSLELEEMPPTKKKKEQPTVPSIQATNAEDCNIIISSASDQEVLPPKQPVLRDSQYELALSFLRDHKKAFESDDDLMLEDPDTEAEPPPSSIITSTSLTNVHISPMLSHNEDQDNNLRTHSEILRNTNTSPPGDFILQTPPSSDEDMILEPPEDDDIEGDMLLDDSLRELDDRIANLAYRESRLFPDEEYTPASSSQSTQDSGCTTLPSSQANSQESAMQKSWQTALDSQVMKDVESAVDKMAMAVEADSGDEILCSDEE